MIFVNFWIAFRDASIFSHFWSFRYFPRYRELIQVFHFSIFPYFSLSSSNTILASQVHHLMQPPSPCCIKCVWANSTQVKSPMLCPFPLKRSFLAFFSGRSLEAPAFGSIFDLNAALRPCKRNTFWREVMMGYYYNVSSLYIYASPSLSFIFLHPFCLLQAPTASSISTKPLAGHHNPLPSPFFH